MKEKKIAAKNYIIITLIFAATICLTLYLCSCYNVYNESQKEIPVIRGTLSEITDSDFEHYIMENQNSNIYMCTASNLKCRNFEKDFKKLLNKKNLQESFIYLNLSNTNQESFIKSFNEKYPYKIALTENYPAIVIFEDGKISNLLQKNKDEELTMSQVKQFIELNKIGE